MSRSERPNDKANQSSREDYYMKRDKPSKKRVDVANTGKQSMNGLPHDICHRIAETAYELYEQRGRTDGHDLDDWFKAEALLSNGRD
jgi:hypothetical protein